MHRRVCPLKSFICFFTLKLNVVSPSGASPRDLPVPVSSAGCWGFALQTVSGKQEQLHCLAGDAVAFVQHVAVSLEVWGDLL